MPAHTYRVITHIHSVGSTALASPGYAVINGLVQRGFGATADQVDWSECVISVADFDAILNGRRTRKPVDLLFVTDHMSPQRHVLDEAVFDLARRCRRFGVGAEIQTCLPDGAGGWAIGPDVLVYGPATLHPGPMGGYHGLTQAILDEAFAACTSPGAPMPETHLLRTFCEHRGMACALSHPLDGHTLPLKQMLGVIASFDFVETINGGYSDASARTMARLLGGLRRAQRDPGEQESAAPKKGPPPALIGLGGSDAHLSSFDRAVTLFRRDGDRPDAGDFIAAMLRARREPDAARREFIPAGRGIRAGRLAVEVVTLGVHNLARNRHLLPSWGRFAAVLGAGLQLAAAQLRDKRNAAVAQRKQIAEWMQNTTAEPSGPDAA